MSLLDQGVPCGPVLDVPDVAEHPHTRHREMVVAIGEAYRGMGVPIKMSRTPGRARTAPPRFGESTRKVLARAGYAPDEIETLIADKIAFAS